MVTCLNIKECAMMEMTIRMVRDGCFCFESMIWWCDDALIQTRQTEWKGQISTMTKGASRINQLAAPQILYLSLCGQWQTEATEVNRFTFVKAKTKTVLRRLVLFEYSSFFVFYLKHIFNCVHAYAIILFSCSVNVLIPPSTPILMLTFTSIRMPYIDVVASRP